FAFGGLGAEFLREGRCGSAVIGLESLGEFAGDAELALRRQLREDRERADEAVGCLEVDRGFPAGGGLAQLVRRPSRLDRQESAEEEGVAGQSGPGEGGADR